MRRLTSVAAGLALLSAVGLRVAEGDETGGRRTAAERALFGDSGPDEAEEPPASAAPSPGAATEATPRRQRRLAGGVAGGGKRRHRGPAGRVVADEDLREGPLPAPSGKLRVVSINSHEEADVNLFNHDGSYDVAALAEVSHVLRCRRTDDEKPIDPRLLTLLSHVYDHFGGRPLEVVSGYRNQRKQTSNHYKGTASDIRITGVSLKKIRSFAETLDTGGMGIGIYPKANFVHIDVRPPPSYRWIDNAPPNPDAKDKRPPRGWKQKRLQS